MLINGILLITALIINTTLGLLVIWKNPKSRIHLSFGILMFFIAAWIFTRIMADIFYYYVNDPNNLFLWVQSTIVPAIFIPSVFLYFTSIFPRSKPVKWWHKIIIFLPGFIILLFTPTGYNIKTSYITSWGRVIIPGELYIWFSIYFLLYMTIALYVLAKKYYKEKLLKIERVQIKYIFWGSLIASYPGLILSSVLIQFGIYKPNMYAPAITIIFSASVAYAILKYRFLDIKIVFKKGLIYTISLTLAIAIYTYFSLIFKNPIIEYFKFSETTGIIILVLIIALGFTPLKILIEKLFGKIFISEKDPEVSLQEVQKISNKGYTELANLFKAIQREINKVIEPREIRFLIHHKYKEAYEEEYPKVDRTVIDEDEFLIRYLEKYNKALVLEEISYKITQLRNEKISKYKKLEERMRELDVDLALPFIVDKKLTGLILLGAKKSNKLFTVQDIKYLEYVAQCASLPVATTFIYKQALDRTARLAREEEIFERVKK